jgi:hypothetical protein
VLLLHVGDACGRKPLRVVFAAALPDEAARRERLACAVDKADDRGFDQAFRPEIADARAERDERPRAFAGEAADLQAPVPAERRGCSAALERAAGQCREQ